MDSLVKLYNFLRHAQSDHEIIILESLGLLMATIYSMVKSKWFSKMMNFVTKERNIKQEIRGLDKVCASMPYPILGIEIWSMNNNNTLMSRIYRNRSTWVRKCGNLCKKQLSNGRSWQIPLYPDWGMVSKNCDLFSCVCKQYYAGNFKYAIIVYVPCCGCTLNVDDHVRKYFDNVDMAIQNSVESIIGLKNGN